MTKEDNIFVIVKHFSLKNADSILEHLDNYGTRSITKIVDNVPLEVIAKHYEPHKEKNYFEPMIHDQAGKPAIISLYKGDLNLFLSAKNTIREKYRHEIEPHPNYKRDAIHTSDSEPEFIRETNVWGDYLK